MHRLLKLGATPAMELVEDPPKMPNDFRELMWALLRARDIDEEAVKTLDTSSFCGMVVAWIRQ